MKGGRGWTFIWTFILIYPSILEFFQKGLFLVQGMDADLNYLSL